MGEQTLKPFPLLADVAAYQRDTFALPGDDHAIDVWLGIFEGHLPSLVKHAEASEAGRANAAERIEAMRVQFADYLKMLRDDPNAIGDQLSVFHLCEVREDALRDHDIADPYLPVKSRENEQALELLPMHLGYLDAMTDEPRMHAAVAGVFAGNQFDLGAAASLELFEKGEFDFHATLEKVLKQDWLCGGFKDFETKAGVQGWQKALCFVDNAGADLVLGMLPFMRELLKRGVEVVIAANGEPSLNDITVDELVPLLDRVAQIDQIIARALDFGQLTVVASGCRTPLIDLNQVSDELAAACQGVDLVVIEGMGRALETNFDVALSCDTLKLAMIKESFMAAYLNGQMYDAVCRFDLTV